MAEVTSKLNTTGLHCRSCSMLIDMTLGDLDGVVQSSTDHATGISMVTFDDSKLTVEQVIEAIRGAGYEAEVAQ